MALARKRLDMPAQADALPGGGEQASRQTQDTASRKAVNDAVAYIRGLAELRGRNAEWAEQAVRGAASLSANSAIVLA